MSNYDVFGTPLFALSSHGELATIYQSSASFSSCGSKILVSLILTLTIVGALINLIHVQNDRKEPPEVYARVPFLGHIFGFWRHGIIYFKILAE